MTKNRKMVIMISVMIAALIVLGGTTVSGYVQASKYKMNLDYNYQRAMRDLNDCVANIESTLNKSVYANTATQQNGLAAKLMRETSMAKAALAVLPLESGTLDNVGKYITQVGDFSMSLSAKVSAGKPVTEEEYASMKSLETYAKSLKKNLQDANPDFFSAEGAGNSFNAAAEDFTDYPSLIYDGPFSDHIGQREPKLLKGAPQVLQGNAQNTAAAFIGAQPNQLSHNQDSAGGLPTFNFTVGNIRISVTKAGGVVSSFTDGRSIGPQAMDTDAARKTARAFLDARGVQNMRESYFVVNDGICTINFAFEQDGVICYPDLIKVSVGMDNGSIVEYNASGYLMNHAKREPFQARIPEEKARLSVSPHLTVKSSGLALIPTPGLNEVLCYEFLCAGEQDDRVLVYINAETGLEEQILIMMQSDNGILVE